MVKHTRRKLSKICASLSVIPITGCMSWDDSSDTRVKNIDIINRTSDRQTINILIVESDDVVYWKSIDMEPTLESDESYSSEILRDILSQSGDYVLYAWKNDQPRSAWQEYNIGKLEVSCTNLLIIIGNENLDEDNIDIKTSAGCPDVNP